MHKKIVLPVLSFALCFWVPSLQAGPLEKGQAAYSPDENGKNLRHLISAAERGNVEARHILSDIYYTGREAPKNYEESAKWARMAAGQNHAVAQYHLAMLYLLGHGVPQDDKQYVKWCGEAAVRGYPDAQFGMGNLYSQEDSGLKNYKLAVQWYRKAVKQGHVMAHRMLAYMYYEGKGVPKDHERAFYFMRKAAQEGDSLAQYRLGLMCHKGEGVPQNEIEAYKWVFLSKLDKTMPVADAAKMLEKLQYLMTTAQIKEGMLRARQVEMQKIAKLEQARAELDKLPPLLDECFFSPPLLLPELKGKTQGE